MTRRRKLNNHKDFDSMMRDDRRCKRAERFFYYTIGLAAVTWTVIYVLQVAKWL